MFHILHMRIHNDSRCFTAFKFILLQWNWLSLYYSKPQSGNIYWSTMTQIKRRWNLKIVTLKNDGRRGEWNHQKMNCLMSSLFRIILKKSTKLRITTRCESGEVPGQRSINVCAVWSTCRRPTPHSNVTHCRREIIYIHTTAKSHKTMSLDAK